MTPKILSLLNFPMLHRRHITLKILIFLILIDLAETFAQFCFKKSVCAASFLEIHNFSEWVKFILVVLPSPFLWLGLFLVLAIFTSWSAVLSRIDLSVAVPVCSFSYITVPLVSAIFLGEHISHLRWFGITFILIGVFLVSLSAKCPQKTS